MNFDQGLAQKAGDNLRKVREQKPLIHNITNFVVMNYTANVLLAMGASPVMAHAQEEVEEMVSLAGCLVLNIGTLTSDWVESMIKAGLKANRLNIPVILDPVGSGATTLRTTATKRIINELSINVIRGNASEVLSIARKESGTKGVDSTHGVDDAAGAAVELAGELGSTIVITGEIDLITDGQRTLRVYNGHPMMGRVTGTGCAVTATIGAFLSVDKDALTASATALAYFGLSGEIGAGKSRGPGSFIVESIDALYNINEVELERNSRIL